MGINELALQYAKSIYHIDESEIVLCDELEKSEQSREHFKNGYIAGKKETIDKILRWCRNNSIAEYMGVDSWVFEEELKKAIEKE